MENIQEKMASLGRYREALDEGEKELFDILIGCANDIFTSIEQGGGVNPQVL